ncbi:c-type cytochrome [Uliginosibacterium paludis]|uniref:Cytochrome c n=1 Tax=Uliginosibacterium paludis TaxID=1615952 RepID=A0ABV2CTA6_9RHOO
MKIKHLAALLGACLSIGTAFAQAKPESQIEYRKSAMTVTARSFGVLGAMAKGDIPFNKEVATRHANLLANLSDLPLSAGAFGPGTDKGAPTKADPKVFSEPEKFKAAYEKFTAATHGLPAAAGDLATLKVAVADLGKTCKGCHDDYRMK